MLENKTVVCFGDSNTWGYNSDPATDFRYEENQRWVNILQNKTGAKFINCGINGREIPVTEMSIEALDWLDGSHGSVLFCVMLGTNDILNNDGFTAERTGFRMKRLLDILVNQPAVQNKTAQILLIAPANCVLGSWANSEFIVSEISRLGKVYESIAKACNIRFFDAGTVDIGLLEDGVHFTKQGHRAMAEALERYLAE